MTTTTTINGLRVPELTDSPPNIQTAVGNLATDLDSRLIPRFASISARDTAIPSPTKGQMCALTSSADDAVQWYDGSAWVNLAEAPVFVLKSADESVTSSAVVQNDDELTLPGVAGRKYELTVHVIYVGLSSTTLGGLKWAFTLPTGTGFYGGQSNGLFIADISGSKSAINPYAFNVTNVSSVGDSVSQVGSWSGSATTGDLLIIKALLEVTTSGTIQFQWGQAASSATATTIRAGSYMKLERLA